MRSGRLLSLIVNRTDLLVRLGMTMTNLGPALLLMSSHQKSPGILLCLTVNVANKLVQMDVSSELTQLMMARPIDSIQATAQQKQLH